MVEDPVGGFADFVGGNGLNTTLIFEFERGVVGHQLPGPEATGEAFDGLPLIDHVGGEDGLGLLNFLG